MAVRITCIRKDGGNHSNPHEAISHLRWLNENTGESDIITRLGLYDWLKQSTSNQAYVKDNRGNIAYVGTAETAWGTKYVRTYADRTWTDNLLSLPECR